MDNVMQNACQSTEIFEISAISQALALSGLNAPIRNRGWFRDRVAARHTVAPNTRWVTGDKPQPCTTFSLSAPFLSSKIYFRTLD